MTDWIVDAPSQPRAFPRVRHGHPNGTLDAVPIVVPVPLRVDEPTGSSGRGSICDARLASSSS